MPMKFYILLFQFPRTIPFKCYSSFRNVKEEQISKFYYEKIGQKIHVVVDKDKYVYRQSLRDMMKVSNCALHRVSWV